MQSGSKETIWRNSKKDSKVFQSTCLGIQGIQKNSSKKQQPLDTQKPDKSDASQRSKAAVIAVMLTKSGSNLPNRWMDGWMEVWLVDGSNLPGKSSNASLFPPASQTILDEEAELQLATGCPSHMHWWLHYMPPQRHQCHLHPRFNRMFRQSQKTS